MLLFGSGRYFYLAAVIENTNCTSIFTFQATVRARKCTRTGASMRPPGTTQQLISQPTAGRAIMHVLVGTEAGSTEEPHGRTIETHASI